MSYYHIILGNTDGNSNASHHYLNKLWWASFITLFCSRFPQ